MPNSAPGLGGNPPLATYEASLGLPEGFAGRPHPEHPGPRVREVLELRERNRRRGYLLGVLLAYVGVAEDLLGHEGAESLPGVFEVHPPHEFYANGKRLNTLTLGPPEHSISLRTYYNAVEQAILGGLLRIGYPNSAPHATQSWSQHRREFEVICEMSPGERTQLAKLLWTEVLALEEQRGRSGQRREIRPFEYLIRHFPNTCRGEPAGSVLQGLAYAYYRADSPNVTLRVHKVGSGSARVGSAGDVDGWIGDTLELTVEVKDMDITEAELHQFHQFVKHLDRWPNATAVALALTFTPEAVDWLREREILAFDRERMQSNVAYWDLPKQRLAVQELLHYLAVVQRSPKLLGRFREFCAEHGVPLGGEPATPVPGQPTAPVPAPSPEPVLFPAPDGAAAHQR
ncbi:hypothetical protein E0L36_19865 [Streptomyces sp. AJS327]|uniref:hypothetical protein n=1 Tax=Streptomyces sp. AJS327 TaxID=2545265 RepID=UPI0015E00DC5|nr:hypothetical protein [Streptomyces sp. AJS327]MBA0053045.1 hypothetical protein [Streptomyces sp. AJS327]